MLSHQESRSAASLMHADINLGKILVLSTLFGDDIGDSWKRIDFLDRCLLKNKKPPKSGIQARQSGGLIPAIHSDCLSTFFQEC